VRVDLREEPAVEAFWRVASTPIIAMAIVDDHLVLVSDGKSVVLWDYIQSLSLHVV
jgi:hypothetical protein